MPNRIIPVLVIEDNDMVRTVLVRALRNVGFTNITEASNGVEASALLSTQSFDLVISDWDLEDMITGLDLLKQVRANLKTQDTPFILMTGGGESGRPEAAEAASVSAYMTKPYRLAELYETLERVLLKT